MKNKVIYTILIIVLILIIGGWMLYSRSAKAPVDTSQSSHQEVETIDASELSKNLKSGSNSDATNSNSNQSSDGTTNTPPINSTRGVFSNEGDIDPEGDIYKVTYDSQGFSPDTLNIKVGDIVVFENKTNKAFQPASNPHPAHSDYPGFDSLTGIAENGKFSFQFTKTGSFGYHDHLNPAMKGVINVSK